MTPLPGNDKDRVDALATNTTGSNTGDQTDVSGNAGTATALQTPRTINGISFNGTQNIAIKLDEAAAPTDVTTLDASTSAHGLLKKLPGGTSTFLRADGAFAAPVAALPDLVLTRLSTNGDQTVTAGYGAYIPFGYEIGSGNTLEIGALALLEIG